MPMQIAPVAPHPQGEVLDLHAAPSFPLAVDTHGRRFHVEWDAGAPVTPAGQLVFFSQFLASAGLFHDWVKACPLVFASNNAPALNALLGTITLAILAGQYRYSHTSAPCALTRSIQRGWAWARCAVRTACAAPLPGRIRGPAPAGRLGRCVRPGCPPCANQTRAGSSGTWPQGRKAIPSA